MYRLFDDTLTEVVKKFGILQYKYSYFCNKDHGRQRIYTKKEVVKIREILLLIWQQGAQCTPESVHIQNKNSSLRPAWP